jgi:hypothetical protein
MASRIALISAMPMQHVLDGIFGTMRTQMEFIIVIYTTAPMDLVMSSTMKTVSLSRDAWCQSPRRKNSSSHRALVATTGTACAKTNAAARRRKTAVMRVTTECLNNACRATCACQKEALQSRRRHQYLGLQHHYLRPKLPPQNLRHSPPQSPRRFPQ